MGGVAMGRQLGDMQRRWLRREVGLSLMGAAEEESPTQSQPTQ